MMLDFLNETDAAQRVRAACAAVVGLKGSTTELGDAVAANVS